MKKGEKIEVRYETIGVVELRNLQELNDLNRLLTKEEYLEIANVYRKVVDRMMVEAKKQGIEI